MNPATWLVRCLANEMTELEPLISNKGHGHDITRKAVDLSADKPSLVLIGATCLSREFLWQFNQTSSDDCRYITCFCYALPNQSNCTGSLLWITFHGRRTFLTILRWRIGRFIRRYRTQRERALLYYSIVNVNWQFIKPLPTFISK